MIGKKQTDGTKNTKWLFGSYRRKLGTDGRVAIPKAWQHVLAKDLVLSLGPDGILELYPIAEWDKTARKMNREQYRDDRSLKMARKFFSLREPVRADGQWRFVIPRSLRKDAKLGREIVLVSLGSRAEIWPAARWGKEFRI